MKTEMKNIFSVLFAFVLLSGAISAAQVTLYPGWNMITPNDDGLTASAISNACSQAGSIWNYDGTNYVRQAGTLEAGKGYWVRVNSQCTVNTNGNAYSVTSLSLNSGWNQIGIPSSSGAYSSTSTCSIQGGPWYYDTSSNSYQRSDISSLVAGKGYWVKTSSACALYFGDSPPLPPEENGTLSYISAYASPTSLASGETATITVYAYDADGTYSTAQEGTKVFVASSTSPMGASYQTPSFTSDGSKYVATFSAKTPGSYTLHITASKNGVEKSGSVSLAVKDAQQRNYTAMGIGSVLFTEHYKIRLSDITDSNAAIIDILDSNSNLLSQVTVNSGSTYVYGINNYAVSIRVDSAAYSQDRNSRMAYVGVFEYQIGNNLNPLGKIAYWYGKVNQHQNLGGSWLTDSDGVSGANIDQLTYCQKFFPGSLGVNETGRTYIGNWRDAGNNGQYGEYGVEYACLPFSYYRVVTNLRPPANETGTATFTSTPSGAYVVIKQDDRTMAYGTTPYSVRLQYGNYVATYSKDGYANYTSYVNLNARTQTFSATLSQEQHTLGQVAYWHGKYNEYRAVGGTWQSDASAGANTDQLAYCQQKFPGALGVNEVTSSYIYNWKDASGKTYNGYGIVYDCLSYAYRSTPTNLRPQTQGTAMHINDEIVTQHFRVRLYDVNSQSPYGAYFDIFESNGNTAWRQVSPGTNHTLVQPGASYGIDIKVYGTEPAIGKGSGYEWADVSASEVTVAVENRDPVGHIAYWSGKVNMHSNYGYNWQTDSDSRSGASINQLEYCKKFFPSSKGFNETGRTYVSGWKDSNGNSYNGYGVAYACLPFEYSRAVTDLAPEPAEPTVYLDTVSMEAQQDTISAGGSTQVYLYAYDSDRSQATASEGTTISKNVLANGKGGYSLSSFVFSNNRYIATFSATQAGSYMLYTTVKKGDKELTATATVYVDPVTLGQIAQWSGKVNMHRDTGGQWETDSDGSSGSGVGTLEYCKKFFTQTTSVTSAGNVYISGWKNSGNQGSFNGTGAVYNCVTSTYTVGNARD